MSLLPLAPCAEICSVTKFLHNSLTEYPLSQKVSCRLYPEVHTTEENYNMHIAFVGRTLEM